MKITEKYSEAPVYEQLNKEAAATVAKYSTNSRGSVSYDVTGNVQVVGGKKIHGPLLATDLQRDEAFVDDFQKNAYPTLASKYRADDAIGLMLSIKEPGCDYFGAMRNYYLNTTVLTTTVLEDIQYCDTELFYDNASFKSSQPEAGASNLYSDGTGDAWIASLINGPLNHDTALTRRYARLAKTIKDAVMAQTNNTNPFYYRSVSEIYDRLTDLRVKMGRAISLLVNARSWLNAESLIQAGAVAYYPTYKALYSPEFKVELSKRLASLAASMAGLPYDPISLADYMEMATMGLMPNQEGGCKFIAPAIGAVAFNATATSSANRTPSYVRALNYYSTYCRNGTRDVTGGFALIPGIEHYCYDNTDPEKPLDIEKHRQLILSLIDSYITYFHSQETSIIVTGIASVNIMPMLPIVMDTGLHVKTKLCSMLTATRQVACGNLFVRRPSNKPVFDAFTLCADMSEPGATAGQALPEEQHVANGNTASMISNYNGCTVSAVVLSTGGAEMQDQTDPTLYHMQDPWLVIDSTNPTIHSDDLVGAAMAAFADYFLVPDLSDTVNRCTFSVRGGSGNLTTVNDKGLGAATARTMVFPYYTGVTVVPNPGSGEITSATRKLLCVVHYANAVLNHFCYEPTVETVPTFDAKTQPGSRGVLDEGRVTWGSKFPRDEGPSVTNVVSAIKPCVAPVHEGFIWIIGSQTTDNEPIYQYIPNLIAFNDDMPSFQFGDDDVLPMVHAYALMYLGAARFNLLVSQCWGCNPIDSIITTGYVTLTGLSANSMISTSTHPISWQGDGWAFTVANNPSQDIVDLDYAKLKYLETVSTLLN